MRTIITVKTRRGGLQERPLIVVISKKVAKRAVTRNLFKRRIREIMRPLTKPGEAYTVIAHRGAAEASFEDLRRAVESYR